MPEQIKRERERVGKLLEGVTEGEWVIVWLEPARIKTGAGIIEVNGSHSYADFHLMAAAPDIARAYLALLDAHLALHAQLAQAGERERLRALGAELKAGELETERLKAKIDHAWEALEAHRDSTGRLFATPVTEPLHLAALEAEAAISRHYDHLRVIRREITAAVKALAPQEAHNE